MTVLIDSDILIEVMRGRDAVIRHQWDQMGNSDAILACSPVTVAELWRGARPRDFPAIALLFESIECLTLDKEAGRLAGEILRIHAASRGVEIADALIAAGAILNECELWTRNRKHYPMKGIRFFNPGSVQ